MSTLSAAPATNVIDQIETAFACDPETEPTIRRAIERARMMGLRPDAGQIADNHLDTLAERLAEHVGLTLGDLDVIDLDEARRNGRMDFVTFVTATIARDAARHVVNPDIGSYGENVPSFDFITPYRITVESLTTLLAAATKGC